MAPVGHFFAQVPQPIQRLSLTIIDGNIASLGQFLKQLPHLIHTLSLIFAFVICLSPFMPTLTQKWASSSPASETASLAASKISFLADISKYLQPAFAYT